MDTDRIFSGLEKMVSILHMAILFLAALAFTFVFIINWEDWFFGVKLAGPAAGLFLGARAAIALVILGLITQYPDCWRAVLPASIAYFGFLFVNAAVTYQTTAPGSFPVLLALLVLVPVLLSLMKIHSSRSKGRIDTGLSCTGIPGPDTVPEKNKPQGINPLLLLFPALVLMMVFMIIVIPFVIGIIVTNVPFLHRIALPPMHDSVLLKVNRSGDPEWETAVSGYSLDFVRMTDGDNGSFLLYGTYFLPGRDDAQIRVLKVDGEGNREWDMTRGMKYGLLPDENAQIEVVDPSGHGATAWLTNGMVLRIDEEGNVTSGTPPADTSPQPAAEMREPAGFSTGPLPAKSVLIRILSGEGQGLLFPVEDTLTGREILSVYSVNPTADGGYLISASVKS